MLSTHHLIASSLAHEESVDIASIVQRMKLNPVTVSQQRENQGQEFCSRLSEAKGQVQPMSSMKWLAEIPSLRSFSLQKYSIRTA